MENKSPYRFLILVLFVGFLISLGLLMLLFQKKTKPEPVATKIETTPTPVIKSESSLFLKKIDETTFDVYADSDGKDIVGYDLLLSYDESKAKIAQVFSAEPSFDIYKIEKPNLLIVTGVKKLAVKTPTVFSQTKILTVKLTPKTQEKISLKIISRFEKETTKLVDSASKIYYPTISY